MTKLKTNKCKRIISNNFNKLFPCSRYSTIADYIHRFLNSWCNFFFFLVFVWQCLPLYPPSVPEWNGNLFSSNAQEQENKWNPANITNLTPLFCTGFHQTNREGELSAFWADISSTHSPPCSQACIFYHTSISEVVIQNFGKFLFPLGGRQLRSPYPRLTFFDLPR